MAKKTEREKMIEASKKNNPTPRVPLAGLFKPEPKKSKGKSCKK